MNNTTLATTGMSPGASLRRFVCTLLGGPHNAELPPVRA